MAKLVLLATFGGFSFAMEWPDEAERIQSTFGAAGNHAFQRGFTFRSEGQLVSSWDAGEVIWTDNAQDRIPFRGMLAIEHQNGFRSVYLGVEPLHNLELELADGQWIGYARGKNWRFEIVDIEQSKLVNPIFVLPARSKTPLLAKAIPEVLIPERSSFVAIKDGMVLSALNQTIVIDKVFPDGSGATFAEISLYWIGRRIAELRINALRESEDKIVLETPKPRHYESVFSPNGQIWFPDIRLSEGMGELELRVEDEVGRVFTRRWNIRTR